MSSGLPGVDNVVDHKTRVANTTQTDRYGSALPEDEYVETTTTTTTRRVSNLRDLVPDWYQSSQHNQRVARQESQTPDLGQMGHSARLDHAAKSARAQEVKAEYLQNKQNQLLEAYTQGNVDFDTLCTSLNVDPAEAARHVASSSTSDTVPREVAQHASAAPQTVAIGGHPPNEPWDPNRVHPSTVDTVYGPDPLNTADPTPSWDRSAAQQAQDDVRPALLGSTTEEDQESLASRFAMELERVASIHDSASRCRQLIKLLDLYITVPQVRRSPAMSLKELSKIWRRPDIDPQVLAACFGVDYFSVPVEEDGYGFGEEGLFVPASFSGDDIQFDSQPVQAEPHSSHPSRSASSRRSRRPVAQSMREYLDTLRK